MKQLKNSLQRIKIKNLLVVLIFALFAHLVFINPAHAVDFDSAIESCQKWWLGTLGVAVWGFAIGTFCVRVMTKKEDLWDGLTTLMIVGVILLGAQAFITKIRGFTGY